MFSVQCVTKVNMSKQDIMWTEYTHGITVTDLEIGSNTYYYVHRDLIMICATMFQKLTAHLQPKRAIDAELVVYIASSSLSMLALLITFTVFCILPKLRATLPGKNNIHWFVLY